ncbi:hypothetical protein QTP86_025866 [Hemibagrus guttatus]|nr:hypothetical protein QTP86_025866 [Hemibagrus guttatus]
MADNVMYFGSGTLLVFAEKTNLHVPNQKVIRSGESDTLQCSVQETASSCAEEQSVYWLKLGSGESHKGIIYTHVNNSNQCKRGSEAGVPTQSCSYTLPKSQLGHDDAGIYHCAVAACGKILFGNGTKVDVKGKTFDKILLP